MPRGNNVTLPSGTGNLYRTLSGGVRETLLILNPNDGIVYVTINSQASPAVWDFIVPSQSRAYLPGPWLTYGLFYADQSGAGRSGNLTVFESDAKLALPDYGSIGRALQAQVTSVDITEGVQPANPPLGVVRLWVDTLNAFGMLIGSGPTNFDSRAMIRATGTDTAVPTQGSGTELQFQPASVPPIGSLSARNAATNTYLRLDIHGAPIVVAGHTDSSTLHTLDGSGHSLTQTGLGFRLRVVNCATGAVTQALDVAGAIQGIVWLVDGFGRMAHFSFRNSATIKITDPDAAWSSAANNPATSNFYWSAGANRYELQNNSGTTFNYLVIALRAQ